ncbi:esterase-like activity of phytase family protein [Sphingomonas sp.]|jgi:hypothetical protein|uniref:esterase-like activity of phytase family protein n=1 Tax=Sphingomonas sp. TaxID=28214 RepID=UPI002D7F6818|nr:esterase-like activity of phytase family protein [Sphingomonas sp.]HEU0043742.1 esterase-like activity of phytase family protein [Sphingomonas sp.]
MSYTIEELAWEEQPIGGIDLPIKRLEMVWGFGSGLTHRKGDPPGRVWAIGDRGPNLKVEVAIEEYGVTTLGAHADAEGAKVMPRLDAGPALAELQVHADRVELIRILPLAGGDGRTLSGLPPPGSEHARTEPAVDMGGNVIQPDPSGIDSEGVVALADGGFVIGDEYGPSLLHVDADGKAVERWVPQGCGDGYTGASYPVREKLPAIAAKRRLNRGFEALAPWGETRLVLLFQSPLANPETRTSKRADHLRLWSLDARTGEVGREWLYPLERVEAFKRDADAKPGRGKRKVSEVTALGGDAFLVLERISQSTKLFRIELSGGESVNTAEPTLEERSAAGEPLPALSKTLILDTDDHPEVGADVEGVTLLSPTELLLVNDNDFGVEGAATRFWRVRFDQPLA